MGFEVTEEEVANAIKSMLPNLFQSGFNKQAYEAFLSQQNLTIPEFEANVRKNLLLLKLQNLALEGVVVTPAEIEQEFRKRNERVKIEFMEFNADKVKAQVKVTPDEIQAYYAKSKASFRTPEKRSFDLLVVDEAKISASINVPESDLRRAYSASMDRYRTPERVKVRHILVMTQGKPAAEIPKLEAKANELLKQVKSGADFAELAKKNSDDPGSAPKGGDLDWVVRGQMVKPFEDAVFSLKPKEIGGVVKTEYGFHIVQVLEKEEARLKPFEEVKDELAKERKRQLSTTQVDSLAEQARAALTKNPQQGQQIAQQLNIGYHHVEKAGPSDPIQEIGISAELETALTGLAKGAVTPIIAAGNKLVVAAVTEVHPARPAELPEVENQIRDTLSRNKAIELVQQRAKEAFDKVKQPGADFGQVAKSVGAEVKSPPDFDREGQIEGMGTASQLHDAFDKEVGSILGPFNMGDRVFVARLTGKTVADLTKLPAEREPLVIALKSKKARDRKDLFEDHVVSELIKDGKVKLNQEAIKRLVANYRS
jgi:peptidyl-prolyl cis-trans isomerase D